MLEVLLSAILWMERILAMPDSRVTVRSPMIETELFMLHSLLHLLMVNISMAPTALQVFMMFSILTLMLESIMVQCLTLVLSLNTVISALVVKELDSLISTVKCLAMELSLTDLIANTRRLPAIKCPPLSMVMATKLESITGLPLNMENLNSQLRAMTRRTRRYLARMITISLLVIHSRKASVAVPDQSDLLVTILLTTLISHMPALTATAM